MQYQSDLTFHGSVAISNDPSEDKDIGSAP